ncbi:hypothetical protein CU044_0818 [Streptomyces sp. L-9-10]|nr:hypothetical protein CU044_0818 [Streptomyces sp. L-9-10]
MTPLFRCRVRAGRRYREAPSGGGAGAVRRPAGGAVRLRRGVRCGRRVAVAVALSWAGGRGLRRYMSGRHDLRRDSALTMVRASVRHTSRFSVRTRTSYAPDPLPPVVPPQPADLVGVRGRVRPGGPGHSPSRWR